MAAFWTCHYLPQLWQRLLAAGLRLATPCLPGNESEKRPDWEGTQPGREKGKKMRVVIAVRGSGRESKVIASAPVGQDANTGVNALRISSNKHLLILRGMLWGMLFDMFHVDCIQGIADSILVPCHGKGSLLTAALHLSNKVTVYLLDHRSRMRKVGSWEVCRLDDTEECKSVRLSLTSKAG